MTTPYISIIIPSYNSQKTIKKTIEGIKSLNSLNKVLELIIVDSSDDNITQEIIKAEKFDKLKLIVPGVKIMPSIQRNIGTEAAKGELFLFIDSDAYPDKNWVNEIDKAFKSGIKVGGGSYLYPDFQSKMKSVIAEYYLQFNEFVPHGENRPKKMVPSCNLFCEKELYQSLSGFPDIRASEDSLFCANANKKSPLYFIPSATVFHIFREDKQKFLNNQKLLGKYVILYRKQTSESRLYKGILPVFLYPLIIAYKFTSIYLRMFKYGNKNFANLNKAIFPFINGLRWWSKGVWQGIIYSMKTDSSKLLTE